MMSVYKIQSFYWVGLITAFLGRREETSMNPFLGITLRSPQESCHLHENIISKYRRYNFFFLQLAAAIIDSCSFKTFQVPRKFNIFSSILIFWRLLNPLVLLFFHQKLLCPLKSQGQIYVLYQNSFQQQLEVILLKPLQSTYPFCFQN